MFCNSGIIKKNSDYEVNVLLEKVRRNSMGHYEYKYEIIDLDKDIQNRIIKKLQEGEKNVREIEENIFRPANISWIQSFSSFIHEIDPYGVYYSDSLTSQWHDANRYGIDYPKTNEEYNIVLAQCLGVIRTLLNGRIKIVKEKVYILNTQNYISNTNSIFNKRDLPLQDNLVFTLMPFTETWSDYIWKEEILPIVQNIEEYHLICKRADDLYGHDVMQDIYESILTASIIIADITNRNANVFYELGIAHSLGKEVILLAQGSEYIPFDLNRFRHCIYSNDGMGYKKLRQYIPKAIIDIFQKKKDTF